MAARIFLVTGSTDGIGKHTALRLAKSGGTVLLHGRNQTRLTKTKDEIQRLSGNSNIKSYLADFASMEGVRKLASDIRKDFDHLDVLINNAGVVELERKESDDGYEMTFAVNVIAPFLLTSLLLDLVKKGNHPLIINVASISQANQIDFNNLQFKSGYTRKKAYELSKSCDIMITLEMAELFKPDEIRVNTLDPGTVNTKMLLTTYGPVGIALDVADDQFNLATKPEFDNATGKYYVDGIETAPGQICLIKENRRKLWDILVEITGAVF